MQERGFHADAQKAEHDLVSTLHLVLPGSPNGYFQCPCSSACAHDCISGCSSFMKLKTGKHGCSAAFGFQRTCCVVVCEAALLLTQRTRPRLDFSTVCCVHALTTSGAVSTLRNNTRQGPSLSVRGPTSIACKMKPPPDKTNISCGQSGALPEARAAGTDAQESNVSVQ